MFKTAESSMLPIAAEMSLRPLSLADNRSTVIRMFDIHIDQLPPILDTPADRLGWVKKKPRRLRGEVACLTGCGDLRHMPPHPSGPKQQPRHCQAGSKDVSCNSTSLREPSSPSGSARPVSSVPRSLGRA